jgi:type VI secretion system protein ImpL
MKLRFASDTDIAPYLLEKSPYYSVVGKKVIYRYDDPWALFDMMNAHGIRPEKSSIGQILKFEFPVRLKDGSTENENIDLNARIFLELRLRSSHDNKRLKFRGTTRIEPPLL